jgi:uncharacterized protein
MDEHSHLLAVADDWHPRQGSGSDAIERKVTLPPALTDSVALVIQGVRRCGKSTLMRQLVDRYDLDPEHCVFINFEDPRLADALHFGTLDALVAAFRKRHPKPARLTFFLDEIQGVTGWERWLRTQLDRRSGHRFVISGSNAALLSGELGSVLTGRHLMLELHPFDFDEFRLARPKPVRNALDRYLELGGFPEPLTRDDGDNLLRQYFHDIVERDVRERLLARTSRPLRQVLQMTFESAGSELSLRRVAAAAGIAIDTAGSYLEAAENAYLVFGVPFFAFSERKRSNHPKKYYPVDTGLRRVVTTTGGTDRAKTLECATFLTLRRHFRDISYWRGDGEVDFVVQDGKRILPIQVTLDSLQPRHERALTSFYEAFPHAEEALTVTLKTFPDLATRLIAS